MFAAIVSGVVGRCSRWGSAGQGHTPAESLLGGCFRGVSPWTPWTVQVRAIFVPWTAPWTDPGRTLDGTRDGHPAGALPRSGTSVCAPLCRCVVRCRPFGAARGDCAGPGRGVGREALSRCGVSGCSTGGHGCPRGRAGRGGPVAIAGPGPGVAEQAEARSRGQAGPGPGWPSWSSWPSWPSWQQGRDRGGRKVGRAAVLPCCRAARAAACPSCRVPEGARAGRGLQELPLVII